MIEIESAQIFVNSAETRRSGTLMVPIMLVAAWLSLFVGVTLAYFYFPDRSALVADPLPYRRLLGSLMALAGGTFGGILLAAGAEFLEHAQAARVTLEKIRLLLALQEKQ